MNDLRLLLFAIVLLALPLQGAGRPSTTANDASCDIATLPAATLLVPYFEVDLQAHVGIATTTVFFVTNVTREPQIAQVTLWTDLDYPILSFPLFLTGYDVTGINLHDVLTRGWLEADRRTTHRTTPGARSSRDNRNPRFLPTAGTDCSTLPGTIAAELMTDVRAALTEGFIGSCGERIGKTHTLAIGYITIDVVATCSPDHPLQPQYWSKLLYDNVLTGDWQIVHQNSTTGNYAEGGPMVHLRAVPEGGAAGELVASALPFTFYDRITPAANRRIDRRQPLPTTFAARFVEGGSGLLDTQLTIWREGTVVSGASCRPLTANETVWAETVRFDERENPTVALTQDATLPITASVSTASDAFPPRTTDTGGWLYLNLNNGGSDGYSTAAGFDLASDSSTLRGPRQSQAWVTSRLSAEGRFAVAVEATVLGNGCTPSPASPTMAAAGATVRPIGPGTDREANTGSAAVTHRNDDSCDIAVQPAATLLLPYFEVDVNAPRPSAETTIFTITNVTNQPRVARVTLWTDAAYPLLTFNLYLTGYDAQSIDLYDVLTSGNLPSTGWHAPPRSSSTLGGAVAEVVARKVLGSCANLPTTIPPSLLASVRSALATGRIDDCPGEVIAAGRSHAAGYLTVDVVATCSDEWPDDPAYYDQILFDNVLTGDYQLVFPDRTHGNYASGGPLVHIRAVPEGGGPGQPEPTALPSTFYGRFQSAAAPHRDRRQPLPSRFAARYLQGYAIWTDLLIWREAPTGPLASCKDYSRNLEIEIIEYIRFDERENPTAKPPYNFPGPRDETATAATNRLPSTDDGFPPLESGDVGGWMYLNLHGEKHNPGDAPLQGWVTLLMSAEGRYASAWDATALGNGCSPSHYVSSATEFGPGPENGPIGPSPNN